MLSLPYNIVCGYCDCSEFGELDISPKRQVQKFEIEYYLEDASSTFVGNQKYKIQKNYIQIAKPGQERYSYLPFKTIYIKFSADGELAERLSKTPDYFSSSHSERIISKLDEIILLQENNDDLLLYSRLLSLLNLIIIDSKIPMLQSGNNYNIITKAKRFIETNFNRPLSLNDISHAVNLSPIYFHNIFTAATNISPHDYLINYRIQEAKKQLWDTDVSVETIAESCGFSSQQYFNKVFKNKTGTTPGKYRKTFQQNYLEV